MFGLSIENLLILGVLALIIFGPEHLPKVAAQAGRALRDLRRIAENAKADLQEGLGPEFQDFDFNDLNPKAFVRKHLWEEFDAAESAATARQAGTAVAAAKALPSSGAASSGAASSGPASSDVVPSDALPSGSIGGSAAVLSPGECPPFDLEAT